MMGLKLESILRQTHLRALGCLFPKFQYSNIPLFRYVRAINFTPPGSNQSRPLWSRMFISSFRAVEDPGCGDPESSLCNHLDSRRNDTTLALSGEDAKKGSWIAVAFDEGELQVIRIQDAEGKVCTRLGKRSMSLVGAQAAAHLVAMRRGS
jgi:predicted PhzF superfamily epimerase YddE/YHI9